MAFVDIMDLARLARVYVQAEQQALPSAPLLRRRYDQMRRSMQAEHVFGDDPTSDDVRRPRDLGAKDLNEWDGYMAAEALSVFLRLPNIAELLGHSDYRGGWIKLFYAKYFHQLAFPERSEDLIERAIRDCIAVLDPSLFVRAHGRFGPEELPR